MKEGVLIRKFLYILVIISIALVYFGYRYYNVQQQYIQLKNHISEIEEKHTKALETIANLETKVEEKQNKINQLNDLNEILKNRIDNLMDRSALERIVLRWYNKKEKTDEDISNILSALPEVNWIKFKEISNFDMMTMVEWVRNLDIKNQEDLINVIKLGQNVDAVGAECYSTIIEDIFLKNDISLIKALTKVPENIDSTSKFLAYSVYGTEKYNIVYQEINELLKNNRLSENEKKTVKDFKNGFEFFIKSNY